MGISLNIGSSDPARLAAFYEGIFGPPAIARGGYASWFMGDGMLTVGPHDEVDGPNRDPGRLLWSIASPDARADFERFTGAGARAVREPYRDEGAPRFLIATLADPDGNLFQVVTDGGA